jgi:hypothetical protein
MTENEAKKKWCPIARHTMDTEGVFHTTNGEVSSGFQTCIASDCMMWRGILTRDEAENGFYPKDGYCGLGGKP